MISYLPGANVDSRGPRAEQGGVAGVAPLGAFAAQEAREFQRLATIGSRCTILPRLALTAPLAIPGANRCAVFRQPGEEPALRRQAGQHGGGAAKVNGAGLQAATVTLHARRRVACRPSGWMSAR